MSIQTALDRIVHTLDSAAEDADLVLTRDHMTSEVSVLRFYPAGAFDAVLNVNMEAHFGCLTLTVTLLGDEERVLHTRCTLDVANETVDQLRKIIIAAGPRQRPLPLVPLTPSSRPCAGRGSK